MLRVEVRGLNRLVMSIEKIKKRITEKKGFLKERYRIERIAIFGSRARKERE